MTFLMLGQSSSGGGGGGGSLAHGDAFTITGSGFGTNSGVFTFLGGNNGPIESTAANADISDSVTNWNLSSGGVRGHKKGYDDATRGRVLTSDYSAGLPDAGCISYDTGSNIGTSEIVYTRIVEYYTNVDAFSSGQIKQIRSASIDDVTDTFTQLYLTLQNGNSALQLCPDPNGGGTAVFGSNAHMIQNAWLTIEFIIEYPTSQNSNTCKGTVRVYDGSNTPTNISFTFSGGQTNNDMNIYPNATRSRWIVFQNYMGNGITTGTVRQDDHVVQRGSRKRIELCETATYSSRKQSEWQPWATWSNTQITGTINKGGIGSGTRYLHVIDDTDASIFNQAVTIS